MTEFMRSIWQTTASTLRTETIKTEQRPQQPIDQITIPPPAMDLTNTQDVIKVEVDHTTTSSLPVENSTSTSDVTLLAAAGKAQRAVRREAVNARRDKRKTMSSCNASPTSVTGCVTPTLMHGGEESSHATVASMQALDGAASNEKLKKIKTGTTTESIVVNEPLSVEVAATAALVAVAAPAAEMTPASPVGSEHSSSGSLSSHHSAMNLANVSDLELLGEERLRAMEAQLEHLDPDSKEAKKKRRLIRNRMSAQLHRERKKAYVGQLEDQLMEKDMELKKLQEQLAAMASESSKLKQQLSAAPATTVAPEVAAPAVVAADVAAHDVEMVDVEEVVIKQEPGLATVASVPAVTTTPFEPIPAGESWDYCFDALDNAAMTDVEDFLGDFENPFSGCGLDEDAFMGLAAQHKNLHPQHHEIHAAKKNIAMMMAVMASVTFFGNSPFFFNLTSGSNFSSMFNANPPKEFTQMSIASRIVACLEKSSWKNFKDISSWTGTTPAEGESTEPVVQVVDDLLDEEQRPMSAGSPSAASDTTDSCGSEGCASPAMESCLSPCDMESDLIDEFEYPLGVEPFMPDADWFADEVDTSSAPLTHMEIEEKSFELSDAVLFQNETSTMNSDGQSESSSSISSRLYEKLTTLWREKNQVLLTVLDGKNEVTQRSVADMTNIRQSMASGDLFSLAASSGDSSKENSLTPQDQSVTFLYPMSAFAGDDKQVAESFEEDPMFLEVSCQLNRALKL